MTGVLRRPTNYDEFADIYDVEYASYHAAAGDVAFYCRLAAGVTTPILELACGTGRITSGLAAAGFEVVGVDISPRMLEKAEAKLAVAEPPVAERMRFLHGDMRSIRVGESLELAIIGFRSFMLLLDVSDQIAVLENVRTQLRTGGRLVVSLFVPTLKRLTRYATAPTDAYVYFGEFAHPNGVDKIVEHELILCDEFAQVGTHLLRHTTVDVAGNEVGVTHRELLIRWTGAIEMQHLVARVGYDVEAVYGDYHGAQFGRDSTEMIWILRKKT